MILSFLVRSALSLSLSLRHCYCFFADFSSSSLLLLLSITWKCPREKKEQRKRQKLVPFSNLFDPKPLPHTALCQKMVQEPPATPASGSLIPFFFFFFFFTSSFSFSFYFSASVFFFFAIWVFDDSLWIWIWIIWWAWDLDLGWVWQRKRENRLGEMKIIERGEEREILKI